MSAFSGNAPLPEAKQRRHAELHRQGDPHSKRWKADKSKGDEPRQTSRDDNERKQPKSVPVGFDPRNSAPKAKADTKQKSGKIAKVAVRADAHRRIDEFGSP